jgi:hypothetical protein
LLRQSEPYQQAAALEREIPDGVEPAGSVRLLRTMRDDSKEQQILWNAALKEIGSRLKRELQPEQDLPDRLRELIAQLEAHAPRKDE